MLYTYITLRINEINKKSKSKSQYKTFKKLCGKIPDTEKQPKYLKKLKIVMYKWEKKILPMRRNH